MKAIFNKEKNRFDLSENYYLNISSAERPCPEHTHDYVEMVYHFSGSAEHFINGVPYLLKRGDLLIIDRGGIHSFVPAPRVRYCDIMLKPSFFDRRLGSDDGIISVLNLKEFASFSDEIQRGRRLIRFSGEDRKRVEMLIKLTIEEQKYEKISAIEIKRSALNLLMSLIFRNMLPKENFEINDDLAEYIRDHCKERLSASSLAIRCGYTAEHFSRKFKSYMKTTFTDYLNSCRLDAARELLLTTDKTIEVIVEECGYSSRGEFFSKFRARFGETPLKFKKSKIGTKTNQNL